MNTMMNTQPATTMLTKAIRDGEIFTIHKEAGKELTNYKYVENASQIPVFLLKDGAIEPNPDNTVTFHNIAGAFVRKYPMYIAWEKPSSENAHKVPYMYAAWPKDNGVETILKMDGKLFDKAPLLRAALMTELDIPDFCYDKLISVYDNFWGITEPNKEIHWGETRKALWVEYSPGNVDVLTLSEPSVAEYIVQVDGVDIGRLIDLI